ncbi:MAG: peptidoglycan DD-metalloendopeptidase family protein, partial [Deltaproteobacteria bacterium]|nr:peptidoglycan DD-metalloendopeptidase family protein [Deltaproteobacteria bacterium]
QALVAEIDADRKYHERIGRDLDIANRQLTERIEALQEWGERKYTFAMVQGKLLAPVSGRIEVPYGEIRNPRFGTVTLHRGLDYRVSGGPGQPVRAVFWGKVAHVGWLTGYGLTVILDHGHGWHTVYAHLEGIKVAVGEVVKSRQRIAEVGQSGSLKGRYLYFEIRHNGQTVDPAEWVH